MQSVCWMIHHVPHIPHEFFCRTTYPTNNPTTCKYFVASLAACNEITRLSRPLQSRFRRLHLPPYTEQQFLEVSVKVLPKLKIAHVIGEAVWNQGGDIRDVISIGKLVRKNDGPEEVEQMLSTDDQVQRNKRALIHIMLSPEGITGACVHTPLKNNFIPWIQDYISFNSNTDNNNTNNSSHFHML